MSRSSILLPFTPTVQILNSETVRGEGAVLRNHRGSFHGKNTIRSSGIYGTQAVWWPGPLDEKWSRAPVPMFISMPLPSRIPEGRFPTIYSRCLELGLKMERDWLPVGPGAHYAMGGVYTDHEGRTTLPGLLACGEAACTGVHGANRLASNSLLEALVFGWRAAEAATKAGPVKTPRPAIPSPRLPLTAASCSGSAGTAWALNDRESRCISLAGAGET